MSTHGPDPPPTPAASLLPKVGGSRRHPECCCVRTLPALLVLAVAALISLGCPSAQPPPAPIQSTIPRWAGSYPVPSSNPPQSPPSEVPSTGAAGRVVGKPFLVRSTTLWQDAAATWLCFEQAVPITDNRYDPRARRRRDTSFVVYLDPARLKPGTYQAAADRIPPDSPIVGASLQHWIEKSRDLRITETRWTCTLVIERTLNRQTQTGMPAINLLGRISLRFAGPDAWIAGTFLAHDHLREDETAPGSPAVPTPPLN